MGCGMNFPSTRLFPRACHFVRFLPNWGQTHCRGWGDSALWAGQLHHFRGDGEDENEMLDSDLALRNELLQVIGTLIAVCVHPLNSLHFVACKIPSWKVGLNYCGIRAQADCYQHRQVQGTRAVPNLTCGQPALFWSSSRITRSIRVTPGAMMWQLNLIHKIN